MAGLVPKWPIKSPLVTGDDWSMQVTIDTPQDMTGWVLEADIRLSPAGPVLASWDVSFTPTTGVVVLSLPASVTIDVPAGAGFDLRQTDPVNYTWMSVTHLNVIGSYTHEAP